jgi:hypothetical protein
MQGVGFQCLAVVGLGSSREHAGPGNIHDDGNGHYGERPECYFELLVMVRKPDEGLADDPNAGDEEQHRLAEGGEVLDFSVPVEVGAIGRPAGIPHRQEGHESGHQVQAGVRRFGQNAKTPGGEPDDGFESRQRNRGGQRRERSRSFLALAAQ